MIAGGCTSDESGSREWDATRDRVSQKLPLDEFERNHPDPTEGAGALLYQQCVHRAGYEFPFVREEWFAGPGETFSRMDRRLFNVDLAGKYGYRSSKSSNVSDEIEQRIRDAYERTQQIELPATLVDHCNQESNDKLGNDDSELNMLVQGLRAEGITASESAPAVRAAETRWRKCMTPVGIGDLPAHPWEMPSPSLRTEQQPEVDWLPPIGYERNASAEEKRIAVADAQCRESSGWAEASYDAEWNSQMASIKKHADELKRYRVLLDQRRQRAERIIAEFDE